MKKENILIISYDLPPKSLWGVATHVNQLVTKLRDSFSIDLASRFWNKDNPYVTITSNTFADQELIQSKNKPLDSYSDFENLMAWNLLFAKKIIKERKERNRPKLIHNHNWMTFPAALNVSNYFNIPIISSMHFLEKQYLLSNYCPTSVDFEDILSIEGKVFDLSSEILVFGNNHRNFVIKNYGCDPNKIRIVPHGVDENKRNLMNKEIQKNCINITYAGRLVPEKGIIDLLKVVREIKKKYSNIILNVAGTGPLKNYLKRYYHDDFIKYHGFLTKENLYSLFAKSDIFCFPSYTETFGIASLEAAANGLPIITSRGKNIEKIFQENEAYFVDIEIIDNKSLLNKKQLYNNLEILITNKGLREEYSNRAYLASKRFTTEKMIEKVKKLYHGSIKSSQGNKK